MPDTSSPVIGANGTTIPVDGFTQPNGDVRQAMVLGDATAATTADVLADGSLRVFSPPVDGLRSTYSGTFNPAAAAGVASANDFWVFQNPALSGRTIRITRLSWSLTLATGAIALIHLARRSTLNTGGTVAAGGKVAHDPANPTSVVTVQGAYTAAPTVQGTLVGFVRSHRMFVDDPRVDPRTVSWVFGDRPGQALVLPPGHQLSLVPAAAFGSAPTVAGDVEWTEQ